MVTIREVRDDDEQQVRKLWIEGFGEWDSPDDDSFTLHRPGRTLWGAEDDGRLLATTADRAYDTWLGGARVPTSGIASVTVQAEARGRGLLAALFDQMLTNARERGAVISTLFPTAPGIYQRFGYAPITSLDDLRVPTSALSVRADTVPTRRATVEDLPAIRAVHERWARQHNGPLTRTGISFPSPDAEVLDSFSGWSVAESSPGTVTGYVSWSRGKGYGPEASIRVWDLLADDRPSLVSLMRVIGSFASVAGTATIRTSGTAEWEHLLRSGPVERTSHAPYMMSVLDISVLEHLTYPDGLDLALPLSWRGEGHVLSVSGGRGQVESADVGDARSLDGPGLALTISGAERSAAMRRLGHLTGDPAHDVFWDFLFGSRQPHVRDYF